MGRLGRSPSGNAGRSQSPRRASITSRPGQVSAVVSWFGPADLVRFSSRSALEVQALTSRYEENLLGPAPTPEQLREASPVRWVTADAPPFLIAHGDNDRICSVTESMTLHDTLSRAGVSSRLMLVGGAAHEDARFDQPDMLALTAAWLKCQLRARPTPASLG